MKLTLYLLLTILFPIAGIAQANEKDTLAKELKGVVIFSSPYEAKRQMPLSYSQVDAAKINLLDYGAEPSYMLQRFPGISYTTDNGTLYGYSYFRFRGLDQSRINITVNGMPLNEPEDAGIYFSNFPGLLSNSSSVQLQRGLGLSKNGAPAFAGSLDFETKKKIDHYTVAGIEAGSFSSGRIYAERLSGNENNLFFYKFNLLTTNGYKYHSGNRSGSGLFQWQHQSKKTTIQYLLIGGKNENGLGWLGVDDSTAKANFRNNGNTEREKGDFFQLLQQLHVTTRIKNNQNVHAGIFFNYTKGNYGFDLFNFLLMPSQGPLITYKTNSSYGGVTLDHQFNGRNYSITSGIYSSLYRKHHNAIQDPNHILLYHNYGDKNEFSPFVKFIYRKGNLYLFSDVQYRMTMFSYTGDVALNNYNWNFFNPLAGAGYRLNDHTYIYMSAGNIKREPGRNDIFLGNDDLQKDSTGKAIYADLLPEKNFSVEAGMRYEQGKLKGSVNVYRMKILNSIDLNGQIGPTGLPLHSNVAKAIRAGIELELNYQVSTSLQLMQSFAWAQHYIAEDSKRSQPVLTPKIISFTEIEFKKDKLTLTVQGRSQSKSYIDFANHFVLDPITSFNFSAKYNFKKIFLSLHILNFTDQKVYSSGQLNVYGQPIYQVQAPLSFLFGLGVKM